MYSLENDLPDEIIVEILSYIIDEFSVRATKRLMISMLVSTKINRLARANVCTNDFGFYKMNNNVAGNFPNLVKITLRSNVPLTLAGLSNCKKIRTLDMAFNSTDENRMLLQRLGIPHTVTSLVNRGSMLCDNDLIKLTNLTRLDIFNCPNITDEGITQMTHLRSLSLVGSSDRKITSQGIACLTNLEKLDLTRNSQITDIALTMHKLQHLDLTGNYTIADSVLDKLTNLTYLSLRSNTLITDAGLRPLVLLEELDLSWNRIVTDAALAGLTSLKTLHADRSKVTDAGLRSCPTIETLFIGPRILGNRFYKFHVEYATSSNAYNTSYITAQGLENMPCLKRVIVG